MENSNAYRPVPATEEIIAKLPREVLEVGCTHAVTVSMILLVHKGGL
jgi:hypothetical protein